MLAANPLIQVTPGLMIWTIVCFAITFLVLRKYAFGPIQQMIDARRQRIEQAISEADNARNQARQLLEEYRADPRRKVKPVRVYLCPKCGGWHLTSSPAPPSRAAS